MRSFMMSTVVGLMVTAMAATSSAQPEISARPKIEVAPAAGPVVKITKFRRPMGWMPAYTGGTVPVVIELENTGNAAVENVSIRLDIGEKVLEKTFTIGGRKTMELAFDDTEGLASSCQSKQYKIGYTIPGQSTGMRTAHIQPSCTFTTSIEETWNLKSPDRVEAEKNGNAYLTRPVLVSAPTCSAGPTMKVRIANRSQYSSPSLVVQVKDADATPTARSQTAAAFALSAGEDKDLQLTPVSTAYGEVPERMKLSIVDWSKSLKGRTSDGGIFVNTKRSCQLVYDLH